MSEHRVLLVIMPKKSPRFRDFATPFRVDGKERIGVSFLNSRRSMEDDRRMEILKVEGGEIPNSENDLDNKNAEHCFWMPQHANIKCEFSLKWENKVVLLKPCSNAETRIDGHANLHPLYQLERKDYSYSRTHDNDSFELWCNPLILCLDLNAKLDKEIPDDKKILDELSEILGEQNKEVEIQCLPVWPEDECGRIFARQTLAKKMRNAAQHSLVKRILFPETDSVEDAFSLLDQCNGDFYVRGFGRKPTMTFIPNPPLSERSPQEQLVIRYACRKMTCGEMTVGLHEDHSDLLMKRPIPQGCRYLSHLTLQCSGETHERSKKHGISEESRFCDTMQQQDNLKDQASFFTQLFQAMSANEHPADTSCQFNPYSKLDKWCRECVVPRSRILVEFPSSNLFSESERENYESFANRWCFDLVNTPSYGAANFLSRCLRLVAEQRLTVEERLTDEGLYHNLWWEEWRDLLWFAEWNVIYPLSDYTHRNRLGEFKLGCTRLLSEEVCNNADTFIQPSCVDFS